ncbi:MAG: TonB-dependent receptor [Tannerellaceae bacterium]|nr:TonB-dependent receptor [Tannerellaceae bacterium]
MRLILFFMLIGIDTICADITYSQSTYLSVDMNNKTIREVFDEIEKNSEYLFFYYDGAIDVSRKVSLHVKNRTVDKILDQLFETTGNTYVIDDRQIFISEKEEAPAAKAPGTTTAQQQTRTITGKVKDDTGEPLFSVNIQVKGTDVGATTNIDGEFTLTVNESNPVLVFSYLGYKTVEVRPGNQNHIDLTLLPDEFALEDVVVVGYGIQKKINLSGAVQAIGGAALESRPIPNVGSGLQGLAPNLNITNGNGRADDAPVINIRGFTSINDKNGEAFVLVDNMPVSREELARLNPNDIDNVSVLKDASAAAIYGARAAFGVVLITTKAAKSGDLQVSFNGNYAVRNRGFAPEIETDVATVMDMKAAARYPLSAFYNAQQLEYGKQVSANPGLDRIIPNPSNPNAWQYYGETDWFKETHNNTAASYTANLTVSKKTDNLSYYVSGGYYQQDGLLKYGNDILRRYNFRSKADIKLADWWKLGANMAYTHVNYDSPAFLDGYFYWQVNRTSSLDIPRNPDGTWSSPGANMIGVLNEGGRRADRTNEVQTSFTTQFDIIKDVWRVNADVNFRLTNKGRDQNNLGVQYRVGPNQPLQVTFGERGGSGNSVNNVRYFSWEDKYSVYNLYTNFTKTFAEKHFLNAMAGYNREFTQRYYYTMSKTGMITTSLPELNLSTGDATVSNTRDELALEGIFGRLNYVYDNRYIMEASGRYDGSSRFPRGDRYGFFPSASVAWAIINEPFFNDWADKLKISNLKLRGSYGALGNQVLKDSNGNQIYYPSISYMSASKMSYILDGVQAVMMNQPGVVSPTLTWENVRTINYGVDFGLLDKLDVNFDMYTRYTDDMLTLSKELPAVFGATPPQTNAADLKTNGWELSLAWRDRFLLNESPFNWSVKFMLSDSKTTITKYDNQNKNFGKDGTTYYEGMKVGEIWGFTTDGFFETQEEIDALNQRDIGTDDVGYVFQVGDIKMKDLDNDNKITFGDNTVGNPGDRRIIGNTSARFPYSFELAADWKGFDFRAFFQGIGKRDWYPGAASIYFWGVYAQPWTNVTKKNMDHWTENNPDAYFPRVKAYAAEDANMELAAAQTRYLQDASYLRMKNLTIGYTLPKHVLSRLHVASLRFYFSAENLLTISNLDKGIDLDPEIIEKYNGFDSGTYPMQQSYSMGVNLTF